MCEEDNALGWFVEKYQPKIEIFETEAVITHVERGLNTSNYGCVAEFEYVIDKVRKTHKHVSRITCSPDAMHAVIFAVLTPSSGMYVMTSPNEMYTAAGNVINGYRDKYSGNMIKVLVSAQLPERTIKLTTEKD